MENVILRKDYKVEVLPVEKELAKPGVKLLSMKTQRRLLILNVPKSFLKSELLSKRKILPSYKKRVLRRLLLRMVAQELRK